ncbi:MAG: hypothetical protein M1326_06755 [Cyanobacteria bacterium]|nr:hypothetical protein [Cyanobacteriota bacterium]
MDIDKYRKDAEDFLGKLDKEYYLHFSGQKNTLDLDDIYKQFEYLFSFENSQYFKNLINSSSGENKKKAVFLFQFCTEGYLSKKYQKLSDTIANNEANTKINIDGKDYSFRYSDVLISNEPDKNKRDEIDKKRRKIIADVFNHDLKTYWEFLHTEAIELGFKNYISLFSQLKGYDFYDIDKSMDKLVFDTNDIYEEHMEKLFNKKLGISIKGSNASDFAFVKRAKEFDVFFKKENLVPIFKENMKQLGIDIDRQQNIIMDVEERENKSSRAFCCPVKVPSEIYLVVMPSGGQDDYGAMFHEGGHAEHFANVSSKMDFEYRYLGDNSVTEGFAFCLENLIYEKSWLITIIGMDEDSANEFVYFSGLMNLFFLRRYASKLKYELKLHEQTRVNDLDLLYSEILSKNLIMNYYPENYLKDVDEGFYCTSYIRAWMFEAQLKDYILNKFGTKWFKNKKAGDFLREIWSYGQKYFPEEILDFLGYKELDINYLINNAINLIKSKK